MTARNAPERLRALARVLALADERRSIALRDAAAEVGMDVAELRELLDPVLFLEWRDPEGELRGESRAFLLTEDQYLVVTEEHWLRGLAARPPEPPTALRLFVAGVVLQAATTRTPSPVLDHALDKLADVLAAEVVVPVERPPYIEVCEQAAREARTLRVRYLSAVHGEPREHEIEPHLVASRWGHWYVLGRVVGRPDVVPFRVDRVIHAELGAGAFEPEAVGLPEWWDLTEHEQTIIAKLDVADLDRLPQPSRSVVCRDHGHGRVEAEITVIGPRRLDHLLLTLGPDAEVTWPAECADRRRELATELLNAYA